MNTDVCSMDGCEKKRTSRGWCQTHYVRWLKYGDPNFVKNIRPTSAEESFALSAEWSGECLVWNKTRNVWGYGTLMINRKHVMAHRYAWERANGPIPDGLQVDHLCWNRACVNVKHLRLATRSQNQQNRRGASRNSTTGIRGVTFRAKSNLWECTVEVDGVTHYGWAKTRAEAEQQVSDMRASLMPFSRDARERK
jgi:hypothetical protein